MRDGLAEAVIPYYIAMHDIIRGEEGFLSDHKTSDLAPCMVIAFVLPVGDAEDLSRASVLLPQTEVSKSHNHEMRINMSSDL